jgi:hypothetical protein
MGFKRYVVLLILIGGLLTLGYGCARKVQTEIVLPDGKTAKIVFIVGDVFFQAVSDSDWVRATVGDIIIEGTLIKTYDNSYCELVLSSGTIFRMKDKSEMQLSALPKDEDENRSFVRLLKGHLFARAEKVAYRSRDTVQTEAATVGMSGTGYLARSDAGTTEVLVSDGVVNVQMNVSEPDMDDLPPQLKKIFRRVDRGTTVREGYKITVSSEQVEGVEEMVREIMQRGSAEEIELEQLRQEIQLQSKPLERRDRELLKELDVLSLNFEHGESHYLSPNFDGIKDDFRFKTAQFTDEKLRGWRLVFLDGRSRTQKTIRNRYAEEDEEILVPETIVWNLINNNGDIVKDGDYSYEFYTITRNSHENLRMRGVIVVVHRTVTRSRTR